MNLLKKFVNSDVAYKKHGNLGLKASVNVCKKFILVPNQNGLFVLDCIDFNIIALFV